MSTIRMAKTPKFNNIENTRTLHKKNEAKIIMNTKMYEAKAPIECKNDDNDPNLHYIDDEAIAL